jgi:hypothetical protein
MPKPEYGDRHRKMRAGYLPLVASGKAICARCGRGIRSDEPWDRGHVDGSKFAYAGPEHRRCNRATSGRSLRRVSRDW